MSRRVTLLLVSVVMLTVCLGQAQQEPKSLLVQADHHLKLAKNQNSQQQLKRAIDLYQKAVKKLNSGRKKKGLNGLSESFYLLGNYFLKEKEKRKRAYRTGRRYGILSLMKNPEFRNNYGSDPEQTLTAEDLEPVQDVAALYWTVGNMARLVEFRGKMLTQEKSVVELLALYLVNQFKGIIKQQTDISFYKAALNKMIELDPTYAGGGPHRYLGALQCRIRSTEVVGVILGALYGLSNEKGKKHLSKAMKNAPHFLENKLFYVKYWAQFKDQQTAIKLLKEIINTPQQIVDQYPLRNQSAQEKARVLLEEIKEEM